MFAFLSLQSQQYSLHGPVMGIACKYAFISPYWTIFLNDSFTLGRNYFMHHLCSPTHLYSLKYTFNIETPKSWQWNSSITVTCFILQAKWHHACPAFFKTRAKSNCASFSAPTWFKYLCKENDWTVERGTEENKIEQTNYCLQSGHF